MLAVLLIANTVFAINIKSIYTSACKSELGVIIDVDTNSVRLIGLDGKVKEIIRHEISGIAEYPLDLVPIKSVTPKSNSEIPIVQIKTRYENEIVDLISGWPIAFTEDKIAFLTLDGQEALIDRNNIWRVDLIDFKEKLPLNSSVLYAYHFQHPMGDRFCNDVMKSTDSHGKKMVRVLPQEYYSDLITIKRKLDHIEDGLEKVRDYNRSQNFYAVPQYFGLDTSLGYWISVGDRHGSSDLRTNIWTPFLSTEFSTGPFGYQQKLESGSGPLFFSVHEEPQTQLTYSIKAEYFHATAFIDPSLVLLGRRYRWQSGDLDRDDARFVETMTPEVGFDYGNWAINTIPLNDMNVGVKNGSNFQEFDVTVPRFGITYHNYLFKNFIQYASGSDTAGGRSADFTFLRNNFEANFWKKLSLIHSLIYREIDFKDSFNYKDSSYTNAFYLKYRTSFKYMYMFYLSHEFQKVETSNPEDHNYVKVGGNINLYF